MSRCAQCGYNNYSDAIVCVHCYAALRSSDSNPFNTTFPVYNLNMSRETVRPQRDNLNLDKLDKRTIVLQIEHFPEPILLRVIQTAFLGRASENFKVHPLLDLTPFGAVQAGISRVHAAIYRTVSGMAIEDRASSNGTWLNGMRLEPRRFYTLASGDHIFFSKLSVEVYIGQADIFTQAKLEPNEIAPQQSPIPIQAPTAPSAINVLPFGDPVLDPKPLDAPNPQTSENQTAGK